MTSTPRPRSAPRSNLWILLGLFVAVLLLALVVTIVGTVAWIVLSATSNVPEPSRTWPRLTNVAIVSVPIVALFLGALLARNISGATFYQQQANNRRISLLFLIGLIGLLTALGEIIVASITFDAYAALIGAGVAALFGIGAALFAQSKGADVILGSAGAKEVSRFGPSTDLAYYDGVDKLETNVLLNVVDELSLAANMKPPRVFVIADDSANAMAVGTTKGNAAIAVTRGMLQRYDREQLQGVVGHELSHIRNGDSRYGVYVAILVGMVALVTDGFLRMVLEGWRQGLFLRGAIFGDDDWRAALAGLATGVVIGLFLLLIAFALRIFAPIAALLVQAAASRQREYLADATSVELTRNPVGLARALDQLKGEGRPFIIKNRGSQHLWFTSPLSPGDDTGWHLLATHPTLDARITRLGELHPAGIDVAVQAAEPIVAPSPATAGPEG